MEEWIFTYDSHIIEKKVDPFAQASSPWACSAVI